MAIIDVVKWDAIPGVYVWKFPSQELSTWTQLIVSETQEAVLLKGGELIGSLGAGRHVLDTENLPILTSLMKIPFGGKSPFTAEVWFINKAISLDVKWGTTDPIQLLDPKYKVMLPVRAFGQFGVQVADGKKFLFTLVGTLNRFDAATLTSHFRGVVITKVKDLIAKQLTGGGISILEINAYLTELSASLQKDIAADLDEFGLKLLKFMVTSINTPEDDIAVVTLKEALAKKTEMEIIGYSYQQARSFDTLETAAGNPGSASAGMMGAGMGLGMGVGVGGAMGGAFQNISQQIQTAPSASSITCLSCRAATPPHGKFCLQCGASLAPAPQMAPEPLVTCDKCSAQLVKGAKFCPSCGDSINACQACGADNPGGNTACLKCGKAMPVKCPGCGGMVQGGSKFCPHCAKQLQEKCSNCSAELQPNIKFCPQCGTGTDGGLK